MAATAQNPSSPVPLDTIPVTPSGGETDGSANVNGGDVVTVFHDPNNFNVKHPLAHTWTLWFTKPPSGKVCVVFEAYPDALTDMYHSKTGTSS